MPDPGTSIEARSTRRRGTEDRGTARRDIVVDSGLGPATVAGVVRDTRPRSLHAQLAPWVPEAARQEIESLEKAGAFAKAKLRGAPQQRFLKRYPDDDGAVVVWIGIAHNVELHVYREFPEAFAIYLDHARGDEAVARLLHESYTRFNRELWHFVHDLGLRPDLARNKLRSIDDQVFRLVLEIAGTLLAAGAAIAAVGATSKQILKQTKPPRPRRSGTEVAKATAEIADELIVATRDLPSNGQKMLAAARKLSPSRNLTAAEKVEVMLLFFKRIGFNVEYFRVGSQLVPRKDVGEYLVMYSENSLHALRFAKRTGEIQYGRFNLEAPGYIWRAL